MRANINTIVEVQN